MQPISQTTYDLNSELLVGYSSHGLNHEPFDKQTILDHSNTELVCYSDPHCTGTFSIKTCSKMLVNLSTNPLCIF